MALGDAYAEVGDLKAYMSITHAADDAELQSALESVSREIERHCNRQFNQAAAASPRVFTVDSSCHWVAVDDFHTTDDLVVETGLGDGTYPTQWAATDYQLEPLNGMVDGQGGWPFWKIRAIRSRTFPRSAAATVRVTAHWGWAAVPAPVHQACLILAAETYKLRDAPFGVAGMDDFGTIRVRDNKMAAAKLSRYCRNRVLVG